MGRPKGATLPERVSMRLSAEERDALARRATDDACSESAVLREALRRYLEGWPTPEATGDVKEGVQR